MRDWAFLIPVAAWFWRIVGTVAILPALFSVMLFDAPGSTQFSTIVLAVAVVTFPAVCLACAQEAMRHYRGERWPAAFRSLCLPLGSVALVMLALAWIEIVQGGKFNG
jgi:hypothetical protein